jgi:RNA polymerase sigma-70 factor (ECF subfamily)
MDHDNATASPSDRRIDDAWRNEHAYLLSLASRMLHGGSDAEDVVQEAFSRLARADFDEINDLRGWLIVVVRRLCLDYLYSAHTRRESTPGLLTDERMQALGQWPGDPADRITLDDQVQLALAVVLDRLTPAERTAFVLHDVFGFPFDAVGDLVGRTAAACRQLASRARRSIRADAHVSHADGEITSQSLLAERFIAACAGGDMTALMALLDPAVDGEATLIGHGPLARVEGQSAVAKRILEFFGPRTNRLLIPVPVENAPGIAAFDHGRVLAVVKLDERDGVVYHLHAVVRLER